MKHLLLIPALLWMLFVGSASTRAADAFVLDPRTDSLLTVYDHVVDEAARYIALRQAAIDSCQTLPQDAQQLLQIAELYFPYRSDSAIYYYSRAIESGDEEVSLLATIRRLRLLASIGDHDVAFREKEALPAIPDAYKVTYFDAMYRLYSEAALTTQIPAYSEEYWAYAHCYADSLINYCDTKGIQPPDYWRRRITQANDKRDYLSSLAYSDSALTQLTPQQHEYAIFAFERAVTYRDMGDIHTFYQWLIRSAITDAQCGITDNGSSWMIAMEAYNRGDLERAYRYINYSVSNANIFHATTRYQQVAPQALIISRTHEDVEHRFNVQLWVTVIALIFVLIGIAFAVFVAHKRNIKLHALNRRLRLLNSQLEESNMVKEQYICRYLEVYSDMIDRLERMARKTEKNPAAFLRKEMTAFYRDFDQTFLSLYPTFVNDFNALLIPEERIIPKQGNMLTTELRIFALVRLGIDSSAKIAQLLHYAPNTIYNYRAQMRNIALSDKDDFERQVRRIGRHVF